MSVEGEEPGTMSKKRKKLQKFIKKKEKAIHITIKLIVKGFFFLELKKVKCTWRFFYGTEKGDFFFFMELKKLKWFFYGTEKGEMYLEVGRIC